MMSLTDPPASFAELSAKMPPITRTIFSATITGNDLIFELCKIWIEPPKTKIFKLDLNCNAGTDEPTSLCSKVEVDQSTENYCC